MTEPKYISSFQNPEVRQLISLREKSRERRKTGHFLLEGKRELQLALQGGYRLVRLYFCPDITPLEEARELSGISDLRELVALSAEVYKKTAYREGTEGVLALMESKAHDLISLALANKTPLLLIAEAPEKPGNIGALLRTADAAALDAVIIVNPRGDLYNPNIIRSSVGCLFTVPIAVGSVEEVSDFLKLHGIQVIAAALGAPVRYDQVDYSRATAIAVGTEASGLSPFWSERADLNIEIPMRGNIDSMNVSVAASIIIFEALRQRNFGNVKP